ncbi:hypothetical protein AYI70_g5958 [Smittium culicis]|uniref:Secreted protein n=1 Tax=Smittium culicis TaxID=133412 RepID=A0A1R1XS15_9FUNG|nr:hypothetical protein AYI70_g5958 [Smittium culicis]
MKVLTIKIVVVLLLKGISCQDGQGGNSGSILDDLENVKVAPQPGIQEVKGRNSNNGDSDSIINYVEIPPAAVFNMCAAQQRAGCIQNAQKCRDDAGECESKQAECMPRPVPCIPKPVSPEDVQFMYSFIYRTCDHGQCNLDFVLGKNCKDVHARLQTVGCPSKYNNLSAMYKAAEELYRTSVKMKQTSILGCTVYISWKYSYSRTGEGQRRGLMNVAGYGQMLS